LLCLPLVTACQRPQQLSKGKPSKKMKAQSRLPIAVILFSLSSLSGCGDSQPKVQAAPPPPAVTVVAVAKEEVRPSVSFTGRVQAHDKVDLRARVEGFLDKRLFREGQDVKESDLLFMIEQAPYQASIAEIKADIQRAEAASTLAGLELERASQLAAREVGTQKRLDETTAKQAEARGQIARLKASLEKAELQLSYTEIRAPLAGRISRAAVSAGNYVAPSSGTLATIVRQDPIHVTFPVTQREMLRLRKERKDGDPEPAISVLLADGNRYAQSGKVDFIDVTVNQGTDTVQVRAEFPNPDRILVDGQLVTVVAEVGKAETSLLIPQQTLQVDQAGPFVLVVDQTNKVEVRRIEGGPAPDARVAVTKGLSAGEKVITEGIQKVRPGQAVQATEVKPQA
jgi:membrane fusion protein (multidrug efflux system)